MKLSSISLIAAALVTIAGGAAAAPALRPAEQTLFGRDVDIYSRGMSPHAHKDDHKNVSREAAKVIELWEEAARLAFGKGKKRDAGFHQAEVVPLRAIKEINDDRVLNPEVTEYYHKLLPGDKKHIEESGEKVEKIIKKLKKSPQPANFSVTYS